MKPFIIAAIGKLYEAYHQYIFGLDGDEKATFAYMAFLVENKILDHFIASAEEDFPEIMIFLMDSSRNLHDNYTAGD